MLIIVPGQRELPTAQKETNQRGPSNQAEQSSIRQEVTSTR